MDDQLIDYEQELYYKSPPPHVHLADSAVGVAAMVAGYIGVAEPGTAAVGLVCKVVADHLEPVAEAVDGGSLFHM